MLALGSLCIGTDLTASELSVLLAALEGAMGDYAMDRRGAPWKNNQLWSYDWLLYGSCFGGYSDGSDIGGKGVLHCCAAL